MFLFRKHRTTARYSFAGFATLELDTPVRFRRYLDSDCPGLSYNPTTSAVAGDLLSDSTEFVGLGSRQSKRLAQASLALRRKSAPLVQFTIVRLLAARGKCDDGKRLGSFASACPLHCLLALQRVAGHVLADGPDLRQKVLVAVPAEHQAAVR